MSTGGQGTKCRIKIAENFNRLSRVHERYRQTDYRQTNRQQQIANVNMNSRSLKEIEQLQPIFFAQRAFPLVTTFRETETRTKMWANAQRDGRPAEYRWRPVQRRKVWLTPTTRVPCSNAAKTRNPLKFAGLPQTLQQISAVSGPKFTILPGHVKEVLLFNRFFFRLSIHALVLKIRPDKVVRWCQNGDFCVLYFQRAACSTFQTCILNSH